MRESPMTEGPPYAWGPIASNRFNRPKAAPAVAEVYM